MRRTRRFQKRTQNVVYVDPVATCSTISTNRRLDSIQQHMVMRGGYRWGALAALPTLATEHTAAAQRFAAHKLSRPETDLTRAERARLKEL